MHSIAHWMPMLAERSRSPNTCTHQTLIRPSAYAPRYTLHHTLNAYTRRTLIRLNAYAPLAAIMPFCTSSDLSHYFQTPCISLFTVYIRPCQQRDPYPFLFGSPASCAFAHCSCPYILNISSCLEEFRWVCIISSSRIYMKMKWNEIGIGCMLYMCLLRWVFCVLCLRML